MEQPIKFKNIFHCLTSYVSEISMFLLIPLMVLTSVEVVLRAFKCPLRGVVELSQYMMVTFILLGIAYTYQMKGHPRVTFITARLPQITQHIIETFTILLCLFMTCILIWQGWVLTIRMGGIVSDVLRIPQLVFRFLVLVGSVLLFFELIIDLVGNLDKIFKDLKSKCKNATNA